jgi:hypothetical protein
MVERRDQVLIGFLLRLRSALVDLLEQVSARRMVLF